MDLTRNTFPASNINIKDESAGSRVTTTSLPLHRPLVFLRAAKGDDKLEFITGTQAVEKYGKETFDQYQKWWRGEQYLLNECIFPSQGAYVKRLIPSDAKPATIVIEAHVSPELDIQQYQRDEEGRIVYDSETGEPIVEVDQMFNPVTKKGFKIKFLKRAMTDEEISGGYDSIHVKSISGVGGDTKVYPIAASVYKNSCSAGNRTGFKLYIDMTKQTADLVEATGALLWTFVPMEQEYDSNTAYEIPDKYNTKLSQMVMKPNQLDPFTQMRISADDTISRLFYNESRKTYLLPFDIHFYSDNIETIGNMVKSYETDSTEITNGWMANILSLTDSEGNPYRTVVFDTEDIEAVQMSQLTMHYLSGGDDGDISDATFEELIRANLSLRADPELIDRNHYKITHMYDIGYTLETKFAMTDFMANQRYCKVQMAAQDANRHLYSMDEAISLAASIRARCAITPESELYGTPAMRATIFGQSGYVNDTTIKNIIPMTFWNAKRRSNYHNSTYIRGSWAAYPGNVVDIYRDINFIPYSDDQKQLLWDGAANYCQWADGSSLFIPSVRSIYTDTTSLLADDEFTDACIYLMYIVDDCWRLHVSRKLPFATLADTIRNEINTMAYKAFGSLYSVDSTVYLSEEDLANHDTLSIDVVIEGDYPKRIWNTTIIARGRSEA